MTNTQAKEIKLPYSGDIVRMKERVTWGEKMEIQKAFIGDKEVDTSGKIGKFTYGDVLSGSYKTLEIVIMNVKDKNGKDIGDIKEWMKNLDGDDGEILMSKAMDYFQDNQKKTSQTGK